MAQKGNHNYTSAQLHTDLATVRRALRQTDDDAVNQAARRLVMNSGLQKKQIVELMGLSNVSVAQITKLAGV